jgi:hypothetical protein
MKIKTDLKAGNYGSCEMKVNRYGQCKKILCPYPPFKFPCYRTDLLPQYGPGEVVYSNEPDF